MRALVLAAGFGTRLRPLTDELPKPLLPVLGRSLLGRSLEALAAAGCEAAAVNLHHRGEAIVAAFGDRWAGVPLTWSREDPILGTGGALVPLREFFAGAGEVVVVNGDSLCDWPLAALLARHRRSGAAATFLLAGRPAPRAFGGGVAVDRRGRVVALRPGEAFGEPARRFVFAGAHVLSPALLAGLPAGPSDSMSSIYLPLLARGGTIASLVTWRPWYDLGTPSRYLEAVLDQADREAGGRWSAPGTPLPARARGRCVVEAGAVVAPDAVVADAVLLPGARVGAGSRLRRVVVGPGCRVPGGDWADVLLAAWAPGTSEPAGSRREGDLLVVPLDR